MPLNLTFYWQMSSKNYLLKHKKVTDQSFAYFHNTLKSSFHTLFFNLDQKWITTKFLISCSFKQKQMLRLKLKSYLENCQLFVEEPDKPLTAIFIKRHWHN